MATKDVWTRAPIASTSTLSSPTRSSRSAPISNEIAHESFTRQNSTKALSVVFRIGDAVVITAKTQTRQGWLGSLSGKEGSFKHEDELGRAEKVALIVGLYEEAGGRKMVRVRWFARPHYVWAKETDIGMEVEPYELYYVADSAHLESKRTKSKRGSELSLSRTNRPSLCADSLPLSAIQSKAIISSSSVAESRGAKKNADVVPTFLVRKVFDACPLSGGEFISGIDWDALHQTGMEEKVWDTEPIAGSDEEGVQKPAKKKVKTVVVERSMYLEVDTDSEEEERTRRMAATLDRREGKKAITLEKNEAAAMEKKAAKARQKSMAAKAMRESSDEEMEEAEVPVVDEDSSDDDQSEPEIERSESSDESEEENSDDESKLGGKRGRSSNRQSATRNGVKPSRLVAAQKKSNSLAEKRQKNRESRKMKSLQPRMAAAPLRPPAFDTLSTFEKARALLHVGATPDYLPCREEEREDIQARVGDAILGQTGTCIYISGVPGTGKTATVRSVIKALQEDEDMDDFRFLEINGMKIPEPNQAFSQLWEFLSDGKKTTPRLALTQLENHFQQPDMNRSTTVVLVDELDQMVTKKQDVIYNFFNWPHVPHSRLIVIAIANTMDLPERELSGKIRSRLGSNRINFKAYDWKQLNEILASRLEGLEVFDERAVEMAAKRVAGISGDARRALDICRRTAEKVDQINTALTAAGKPTRTCTISDVAETYKEMTNYGSNFFVKRLSLTQKILMLAIAQCAKRAGVPEIKANDIIAWHLDFLRQTAIDPIPSHDELFTTLSTLHSLKLIATESQRLDYFQKVRSLVEDSDLFLALKEEPLLQKHVPRFAC